MKMEICFYNINARKEDGIMENNLVAFRRDVRILDATIRDGGIVNNFNFSDDFVKKLYEANVKYTFNAFYFKFGFDF